MKKLLFVNNNMHIGGVQRALANLLWCIRDDYEIDVLLFAPCGELLDALPDGVRVIAADSPYRYFGLTRDDVRGHAFDTLARSALAAIARVRGRDAALRLCDLKQHRLAGYDAAIAYLHDGAPNAFYGGCVDFVLRHVSAALKIAFLHCDYRIVADNARNRERYAGFDRIAACSQGCAQSFMQAVPELASRVRVVRNCHRFEAVRARAAAQPVQLRPDRVNILTVARLGREKGVDRALTALQAMDAAANAHYWVLGDGIERAALEAFVRNNHLMDKVTFLGAQENPYGYMRAADLLFIPSRHEAAPLVIGEAACLGLPVLSTRTSSAEEMIGERGLGWVSDNTDDAIAEALGALLQDPDGLRAKRHELERRSFDDAAAIGDFHDLLEGRR